MALKTWISHILLANEQINQYYSNCQKIIFSQVTLGVKVRKVEVLDSKSIYYNVKIKPANAIKLSLSALPLNTSFDTIHSISKRATPTQMSTYKHALQLFKLYNSNNMSDDWVSLNVQQNFNARNDKFQIYRISNYKVGRNLIVNRFHNLNNQICYTWLNDSFNTFKVKCKKLFLQQHN